MKIVLVTPAPAHTRHGNRHTAARWASLLRELGHRVVVQNEWDGASADLMIALHALRSHRSLTEFRLDYPERPLVLALTGTDVYRDIRIDESARQSMIDADRMIVLQEDALQELTPALRNKTRVIFQSAPTAPPAAPLKSCFEVTVCGHLRAEKDPFRAAAALCHLPAASRIRVTQIGGAMDKAMAREAKRWMRIEPRYRWLGEVPHGRSLRLLARSRIMVISSSMEGGANVVSEALAAGVPVIASGISGNLGMLGRNYAGYFPVGDERELARLMLRAEQDSAFYRHLQGQCAARRRLVQRSREKTALKRLLLEISRN